MSLLCKKCLATFWPIFGEIRQLFIHLVTLLHTRSNVSLFEASERMFRGCSSFFSKVFFSRDNRARDWIFHQQQWMALVTRDYSVTRRLYNFFIIWPFRTMKNCPKVQNIYQSRFIILPKTNILTRIGQKLLKFCLSGEILPNPVTLRVGKGQAMSCGPDTVKSIYWPTEQHIFANIWIQSLPKACQSLSSSILGNLHVF